MRNDIFREGLDVYAQLPRHDGNNQLMVSKSDH